MLGSIRHCLAAAILLLLILPDLARGRQGAGDTPLTYERDVRPIFKALCFRCHGEDDKPRAKLDLRLVRRMTAGGRSGPAIVPGRPDESLLWKRIQADEMPKGDKKLSTGQKAVLRQWIVQGAPTARPEPADPREARFTEEERSFWAFQPVRRPAIPQVQAGDPVRNPIDAFLTAKLRDKGLRLSPEADRRTLIRRATFDLLGLPPTPEAVEVFVHDPDPAAYEALIDRLLASPQYGERWGRHWLDAAGYSETDGNVGRDRPRPYAYKYRDYVIRSFNADKPYDQFVREQLAGDEMARRPLDPADPATCELLTATGFLRMAPDVTETANALADRNQAVADVFKVVTTSLLGLTVGCAQCHDHKYDPIAQEDYYRLRAVFDPAFDLQRWRRPSERLFDITTAAAKQEADRIEAQARAKEADIRRRAEELARTILDRELDKVPAGERDSVRRAVETAPRQRSADQTALLKKYPRVREVRFIAGFLVEYDKKAHAAFEKERAEVARLRATKPPADRIMTLTEEGGRPAESRLFFRGDPEQPRQTVRPGELAILTQHRPGPELSGTPECAPASSGRRLAYARWLTDGQHPLVGRVLVNRVWAHHFGKGIVATPGDFGLAGDRPSHPELLDWLADEFVHNGWSLKRLHRLLMTSAAYRQQSRRTPALDRIDPDNRLLGRMAIRRLEAEEIRDAMLAVSGDLDLAAEGPSVPVAEDGEGRVILGRQGRQAGGAYALTAQDVGRQGFRRSVYVESRRAAPLGMLETFDLPAMTPNCDARRCSTVAPQALLFLNDQAVIAPAQRLAERLRRERPGDLAAQIHRAFLLLYGAEPTAAEAEACRALLRSLAGHFRGRQPSGPSTPPDPEQPALACLCQTLLCTNRFLYVD